jgi:hypothetical protein
VNTRLHRACSHAQSRRCLFVAEPLDVPKDQDLTPEGIDLLQFLAELLKLLSGDQIILRARC